MVEATIETDSWQDNGGTSGNVREFAGHLIVRQGRRAHGAVAALLAAMLDGASTAPASPATRLASDAPEKLSPLNSLIPEVRLDAASLEEAVDTVAAQPRANVAINWAAIRAANLTPAPITVQLRDVPLGKALSVVLDLAGGDVKLGYRLAAGVIYISTIDEIAQHPVTRIYNVRDLVEWYQRFHQWADAPMAGTHARPQPALATAETYQDALDAIANLIESSVDADSWQDNGGSNSLRQFAGLLVVTTLPEIHNKLESFFEKLRAADPDVARASQR